MTFFDSRNPFGTGTYPRPVHYPVSYPPRAMDYIVMADHIKKSEIREKLKGNRAALEALGLETPLPTKPWAIIKADVNGSREILILGLRTLQWKTYLYGAVEPHDLSNVEVIFPGVDE